MRHLILFPLTVALILSSITVPSALAQLDETLWSPPVNLSQSGTASQPITAVAPDGTLHVMWWDSLFGAQYIRATAGVTQTTWSKPVTIPALWGSRQVLTNTQTSKVTVSLAAPRDSRLSIDARGYVYALWQDAYNRLQSTQNRGIGWTENPTLLSDSVAVFEVTQDLSRTLHLAYIQSTDEQNTPAGIYYRSANGGDWSAATLVYASPYLRASQFQNSHISVAGDGAGHRVIVWDDQRLGQSLYAYSANNGASWSAPSPVTGNDTDSSAQAYASFSSSGELLLFWQDPSHTGCTLSQRRSSDGGQNWRAPERILTGVNRCSERWQFVVGSDKRLWLIGASLPNSKNDTAAYWLAAWDGQAWSDAIEINPRFHEASTGKFITLSCLDAVFGEQRLIVTGCDSAGDVWTVRSNIGLDQLVPALKPIWLYPRILVDNTGQSNVQSLPVIVAVESGKFLAMWSQSSAANEHGTSLALAVSDGDAWTRAVPVLKSPTDLAPVATGTQIVIKAEQPALAADNQNRLHAVWSGGTSGNIFYSWAYIRDAAASSGWAQPIALPTIADMGSWPTIVADPRGETLHVLYAVPYNEGRGIYYLRSTDGGATWSQPRLVLDAAAAKWISVDKPRLALDPQSNTLHAVWLRANAPEGTGPQAVYYSRSTDDGQTWSKPNQIAEGTVDWPRVAVVGPQQVILAWVQLRQGDPNTPLEAWSQFSPAGGDRWSPAAQVSGLGELSGPIELVSDSDQVLAVGMGQGIGGESALVHARWNGQRWEAQEKFSLGQDSAFGNAAAGAIAPGTGKIGVVLRLRVKQTDGSALFETWATQRDSGALPMPTPAPTFTPLPPLTTIPIATPLPTATPKLQLPTQLVTRADPSNLLRGQSPLILSGVLTAIVVIGALAVRAILIARRP